MKRLSWSQTWRQLERDGFDLGDRTPTGRPFHPRKMPSFDDKRRGFGFFKEGLEDGDMSNLSLSRLFVGRSRFKEVDFSNSDLSESRLCWNDFVNCRFQHAILKGCDGRASIWKKCDFRDADLSRCDWRHSRFVKCRFESALCEGMRLTRDQNGHLELDEQQLAQVHWCEDAGDEPEGG
jgi:uncharacterized protein YjbI with pentapeptide repeats